MPVCLRWHIPRPYPLVGACGKDVWQDCAWCCRLWPDAARRQTFSRTARHYGALMFMARALYLPPKDTLAATCKWLPTLPQPLPVRRHFVHPFYNTHTLSRYTRLPPAHTGLGRGRSLGSVYEPHNAPERRAQGSWCTLGRTDFAHRRAPLRVSNASHLYSAFDAVNTAYHVHFRCVTFSST